MKITKAQKTNKTKNLYQYEGNFHCNKHKPWPKNETPQSFYAKNLSLINHLFRLGKIK